MTLDRRWADEPDRLALQQVQDDRDDLARVVRDLRHRNDGIA